MTGKSAQALEEILDENLNAVEHLLSLSLKGYHLAFEKDDIKLALGAPLNGISDFEYEDRTKVQKLFLDFINQKSLLEKKAFVNDIPAVDKELLIKAYFNILESTAKKCSQTFH